MTDERSYSDTVIVPAILVMPGDPWPTEFYARYPNAFRVPARLVWPEGTSRHSAPPAAH